MKGAMQAMQITLQQGEVADKLEQEKIHTAVHKCMIGQLTVKRASFKTDALKTDILQYA